MDNGNVLPPLSRRTHKRLAALADHLCISIDELVERLLDGRAGSNGRAQDGERMFHYSGSFSFSVTFHQPTRIEGTIRAGVPRNGSTPVKRRVRPALDE